MAAFELDGREFRERLDRLATLERGAARGRPVSARRGSSAGSRRRRRPARAPRPPRLPGLPGNSARLRRGQVSVGGVAQGLGQPDSAPQGVRAALGPAQAGGAHPTGRRPADLLGGGSRDEPDREERDRALGEHPAAGLHDPLGRRSAGAALRPDLRHHRVLGDRLGAATFGQSGAGRLDPAHLPLPAPDQPDDQGAPSATREVPRRRRALLRPLPDPAGRRGRTSTALLQPGARGRDFHSTAGMRIALNYGKYRLLPIESAGGEQRYEFFGHGIVELTRLVTGKTSQEIDEVKTVLVSRGYDPEEVDRFFAPVAHQTAVQLADKDRRKPGPSTPTSMPAAF